MGCLCLCLYFIAVAYFAWSKHLGRGDIKLCEWTEYIFSKYSFVWFQEQDKLNETLSFEDGKKLKEKLTNINDNYIDKALVELCCREAGILLENASIVFFLLIKRCILIYFDSNCSWFPYGFLAIYMQHLPLSAQFLKFFRHIYLLFILGIWYLFFKMMHILPLTPNNVSI